MLTKLKMAFKRRNWKFYFDAGHEGWDTWSVWDFQTSFSLCDGLYIGLHIEILSLYFYTNLQLYTGD